MTYNQKTRPRRLGSMRHSLGSIADSIPRFPQLAVGKNLELQGAAMAVPPMRESADWAERRPSKSGASCSNVTSEDRTPSRVSSAKSQDMEDLYSQQQQALAREQKLLQTIASLQVVIDGLKVDVSEKQQRLGDLQTQLQIQVAHYKELYELEVSAHTATQQNLQKERGEVDNLRQKISDLQKQHLRENMETKLNWEKCLAHAEEEKKKEIEIREEKLTRLKSQMADAMQGNSWERQQQLDELTKELNRTQEESELLKLKVKAMQRSLSTNGKGAATAVNTCTNCANLTHRLSESDRLMEEKTAAMKELKSLCARFEKQLKQQDELLKSWAESTGQKVNYPSK